MVCAGDRNFFFKEHPAVEVTGVTTGVLTVPGRSSGSAAFADQPADSSGSLSAVLPVVF